MPKDPDPAGPEVPWRNGTTAVIIRSVGALKAVSLALGTALCAASARAQIETVELAPESAILSPRPAAATTAAPGLVSALAVPLTGASVKAAAVPAAAPALSASVASAAAAFPAAAAQAAPVAAEPGAAAHSGPEISPRAARTPSLTTVSGAAADADGRARFDGQAAAPAVSPTPRALTDGQRMATVDIPGWARTELPITSRLLGRPLTEDQRDAILARTNVWVYRWHSRWTYEVAGGLPDGHYDPKFGIRLMLKTDWRKLKDPETHFRVLMAHEYGHWLQNDGTLTRRYGIETPSVAIELLRGVELVGMDGLKAGRVGFVGVGVLHSFEDGRRWARGNMSDTTILFYRGALGGAAYQVGLDAGRPEAAWEFLRLVAAETGALSPREAYARVVGRAK